MDGHDSGRSRSKRDVEDNVDAKSSRVEDDEDWEAVDKRKHRSSKSRKYSDSEDVKEQGSGRRKVSADKSEERRKPGGSSRAGSGDEDDYDVKRESRSKIPRKSMDERLDKRSGEYPDRDSESSRRRRDEGNEWELSKRSNTKSTVIDNSQSRPRSKVETSSNIDTAKQQDRDSRYPDDKDVNQEKKEYDKYEQERTPQHRRWDESDTGRKFEDSSYADKSDPRSGRASSHNKHGSSKESDFRESSDGKSKALGGTNERSSRSSNRDGRRGEDGERSKGRGWMELQDDESKMTSAPGDTRSDARYDKQKRVRDRSPGSVELVEQNAQRNSYKSENEKAEKQKHQRDAVHSSRDDDNEERIGNLEEDESTQMWDRSGREDRHNKRSWSPEKNGWSYKDFGDPDRALSDSDNEMNIVNKNKEREKEGYRDDRSSRGKDGAWNDNMREWEGSKDHWRRSQSRQEGDGFGNFKEWDMSRREQGRLGSENFHGRSGYRKDNRMRSEGGRGSSGFRHDSSDSIEIRPSRNLDFGREESASTNPGRKAEGDAQQEYPSGAADEEWGYQPEDRGKAGYAYAEDSQERYIDDGSPRDQSSGRNSFDFQSGKGRLQKGTMSGSQQGANSSSNLQSPFGSFNRNSQQGQGPKGGRPVRGGRGRLTGREPQRLGLPSPMMGPPFGHIGLPPGPMQPLGPNMTHSAAPPMGPGVFMPPFHGPLVWPGARGVDMNMLAVPPNLPPMPPGPAGPRFPPSIGGAGPGNSMYFNQAGPVRGIPPSPSNPGFIGMGSVGRETPIDKTPSGWGPQRTSGPAGKAPSRGEQNDYSQNFVDTGMRPQNFIRELELTSVVEDYPKLRELIQRKDEIVSKSSSPPMYYKCDLHEHVLSPDFFGTKFDVILVDPPWEEYVHRAPGITDHLESWTVDEIMNLKIEAIADTPSFIFLWVGDGVGLEQGRQCLKKWGFRRCEDICWVKTNKKNAAPSLRHDSHTLFQHSKEHCLMGIKGTVRRSTDGHIIHANIDTDIIIAEEPSDGSTKKPEDMYRIIEHFALGRRRLELFGEDHNIRPGWLTVGKGLSSSNFNAEAYVRNFADKDGKVWQGGGGRNPPPDAPHLVLTTPEIEALRPKSPPQKNQQQSTPVISLGGSSNRRTSGNSPQNTINASLSGMNMDSSISEPAMLGPWASPMVGFRGPDSGPAGSDAFDGYGFNPFAAPGGGDHIDFDSHRTLNL